MLERISNHKKVALATAHGRPKEPKHFECVLFACGLFVYWSVTE